MTEAPRTVTITRVFDAPIDLVYRAWTEPEHVERWMKCSVEASLDVEGWEPEVGATFRTRMAEPGVFESTTVGRFTAVEPPRLLAWETDADSDLGVPLMRVRVELRGVEGGTEVTLHHTGIPDDTIFGVIDGGWTASFAQLGGLLGRRADRPV